MSGKQRAARRASLTALLFLRQLFLSLHFQLCNPALLSARTSLFDQNAPEAYRCVSAAQQDLHLLKKKRRKTLLHDMIEEVQGGSTT